MRRLLVLPVLASLTVLVACASPPGEDADSGDAAAGGGFRRGLHVGGLEGGDGGR